MKLHDKRDDLFFPIENFPFMRSTIPAAPAYGVYISQTLRYSRSLWLLSELPVEDISLLFGINKDGDKVTMAPIISEEPRYEDNELKKYRDFSCMCCNFSHEKASGRRGDFIARW